MKSIIMFMTILLIVLMTQGCKTIQVNPSIYCPEPDRPVLKTPADDKAILDNHNALVDYALKREAQIKCYQKILKEK